LTTRIFYTDECLLHAQRPVSALFGGAFGRHRAKRCVDHPSQNGLHSCRQLNRVRRICQ
jgi:hypothetical protein